MTASRAPTIPISTCQRVAEKLAFALCDLRVSLAEGHLKRGEVKEYRDAVGKLERMFDGDGPRRTSQCGSCPGCGLVSAAGISGLSTATLQ